MSFPFGDQCGSKSPPATLGVVIWTSPLITLFAATWATCSVAIPSVPTVE